MNLGEEDRVNRHKHSYPLWPVSATRKPSLSVLSFVVSRTTTSTSGSRIPNLLCSTMQKYPAVDDSHFLLPSSRKSPSRQSISNRQSSSSLRASNLSHAEDGDAANGRHSLAHELAVALMPEPSAGSKLLAEELGFEYDEGAEGIDEDTHHHHSGVQIVIDDAPTPSFADELGSTTTDSFFHNGIPLEGDDTPPEFDSFLESPSTSKSRRKEQHLEQDAMEVLANDLQTTDKFLIHLRRLDVDAASSVAQQPALERIASDVIRRINETVRDREGQLRELLGYEREFRRIASEVGGTEVLGHLDELVDVNNLSEDNASSEVHRADAKHTLEIVEEEPSTSYLSNSHDWEMDPDRRHLGDEGDDQEPLASPVKDSFPPPPTINGYTTPAKTIPQLAHLRSFTASLISSLTTVSEHAQVNGAATTEAGRKIRALKNKLGGWRTEWDSAERSRLRIDRWEAGIMDGPDGDEVGTDSPARPVEVKRLDGRTVVQEHLHAFELALADAAMKTQAIMAS
jgi:hypothetical protein